MSEFIEKTRATLLTVWVVGMVGFSVTFLSQPPATLWIVADKNGWLGAIEAEKHAAILGEPLADYVMWSKREPQNHAADLPGVRGLLGPRPGDLSSTSDYVYNFLSGHPIIDQIPAVAAGVEDSTFNGALTLEEARDQSIWRADTLEKLRAPLPFLCDLLKTKRMHIARFATARQPAESSGGGGEPPRLKTVEFGDDALLPKSGDSPAAARKLRPGEYSVGWIFVITTCGAREKCGLANGETAPSCLKWPKTLGDHVLGVTHLVVPTSLVNETDAGKIGADILENSGFALLAEADYDYVPLRIPQYPAADKAETPGADAPARPAELSIADLGKRLYDVLILIARKNNKPVEPGDLVLFLPAALDFKLSGGDNLIVGMDNMPPRLQSRYVGACDGWRVTLVQPHQSRSQPGGAHQGGG